MNLNLSLLLNTSVEGLILSSGFIQKWENLHPVVLDVRKLIVLMLHNQIKPTNTFEWSKFNKLV